MLLKDVSKKQASFDLHASPSLCVTSTLRAQNCGSTSRQCPFSGMGGGRTLAFCGSIFVFLLAKKPHQKPKTNTNKQTPSPLDFLLIISMDRPGSHSHPLLEKKKKCQKMSLSFDVCMCCIVLCLIVCLFLTEYFAAMKENQDSDSKKLGDVN